MFEVGNTYETKVHGEFEFECIAVTETHAWMKVGDKGTAYVWTQDGEALSLGQDWDIKPKPREFWIDPRSNLVWYNNLDGMIHVREVLPE